MLGQKASKATVLQRLKNQLTIFKVPKMLVFDVSSFYRDPQNICAEIDVTFGGKTIVVRSSAEDEDGKNASSAGKYHTELNVLSSDKNSVFDSITKVVASYDKSKSITQAHQIIIQEMVVNPIMSGVLFTHELGSGAPYYVINYDDVTGSTDSVTSGSGKYSNRTLYIRRNGVPSLRSNRFRKLISAVLELEDLLATTYLDIEFAMDEKVQPILLQARPMTSTKKWGNSSIDKFESLLNSTKLELNSVLKSSSGVFGELNILGQMPDWNPVEMIGRVPRSLAFSLYKTLITDGAWLSGRSQMGYHKPSSQNLMLALAAQPFIDTRLSFNSFLPQGISSIIGEKLVDAWISKLKDSPHLHDKVEFEIVSTCYDFDFNRRAGPFLGKILKREEVGEFKERLKDLTFPLIRGENDASIKKCMDKVNKLEERQNHPNFMNSTLGELIDDCISLGTIPFAMLARHGFIAQSILDSLKRIGILDESDLVRFHTTTPTVASKLVKNLNLLSGTDDDRKNFLRIYGHLRPGTYDILSPCYRELTKKELYNHSESIAPTKTNSFSLNQRQKNKINKLLSEENCDNFSADQLIDYIRMAITSREYGKFVFTRSVSAILDNIAAWGKSIGASRESLSHVSIADIQYAQQEEQIYDSSKVLDHLNGIANENRERWTHARSIRLPQILGDCEGVDIVPFQVSQPNFITNKKATGEVVFIDSGFSSQNISGKVILIENADPGFDWIFSQGIEALITKYGGANSHMAIRCAEFDIPAAIGCGEQRFSFLSKQERVSLDCSSRNINTI